MGACWRHDKVIIHDFFFYLMNIAFVCSEEGVSQYWVMLITMSRTLNDTVLIIIAGIVTQLYF